MKKFFLIITATSISCMIFWSCTAGNKLSFLNSNNVCFITTTENITIYDIPDGYNHNEIRFYKGHKNTMIVTYMDSSILYISDDVFNIPNRENIEQLHTIESLWRNHSKLLLTLKEMGVPEELKHKPYLEYNFSYSELYDYESPILVDLRGNCGVMAWRDIMYNDICIGYIVADSSSVKYFDQCIESTMLKIRKSQK